MSKVFDYESSLRRMGDDQELFQEMRGLLTVDAPALFVTLQKARTAEDDQAVQRAAHTLKGLAANFSASRTVAAAARVEQLAKQQQEAGMDLAVEELSAALEELLAALTADATAGQMSVRT